MLETLTEKRRLSMGSDPALRRRRWATIAGVAAILLWSTTVALARSVSEQLGPLTGAGAVYVVAALASLGSMAARRRGQDSTVRPARKYLLGCGAMFVVYMIALYLALGLAEDRQETLEVGLLNYLWPVLTLLLSVVLLGHKARWTLLPGTFLALSGIVLVMLPEVATHRPDVDSLPSILTVPRLLGLLAAITWALYSVLTRKWAGEHTRGSVDLFLTFTAGVLTILACIVREPRGWSWQAASEAVVLGLATYVAYRLWDVAMRRGNMLLVAACSYLTPLLSTLASCLYLAVAPAPQLWWSCLLLMAGSLLSWRSVSECETSINEK
jgi:drug/metabolite transporter (DMT)-like permease